MKDATRKRLSELILEEMSEKIRTRETLRRKLEQFTDLPVERVADAIITQFEYLLSSDLRDLIIHLVEQDAKEPKAEAEQEEATAAPAGEPAAETIEAETKAVEVDAVSSTESIMEHFAIKEAFESSALDFTLLPEDWLYLAAFSYAPDSTGKGIPSRMLTLTGVDNTNHLFLLDYGDLRLYMHRLTAENYTPDKSGKPALAAQDTIWYNLAHERLLNTIRNEQVVVSLPFWTVVQGRETVIKSIEDHYVELLRALIDVHDATDWDVAALTYDTFLIEHPGIVEVAKGRPAEERGRKNSLVKNLDIKVTERLFFREKSFAQDIHSSLLIHATKARIDHMIRLDNALMNAWKPILEARYVVGKDKRKNFYQEIASIQKEYAEYNIMIRVSTPASRFKFPI